MRKRTIINSSTNLPPTNKKDGFKILNLSPTNGKDGFKISTIALGALGLIVLCGGAYALYYRGHIGGKINLPPGPKLWAVFDKSVPLGITPCQAMAKLCSNNYKGIMTICMDNIPTVIVTSSKIALQILEKYEIIFCPLKKFYWPYMLLFPARYQNLKCIPPYNSAYWHKLRQIYFDHLLEPACIMSFQPTHEYNMKLLQSSLQDEMAKGDSIKPAWISLRPHLRHTAFKLIFDICFGRRVDAIANGIGSHKDPNIMQLEALFMEVIRLGPAFTIGDFIPATYRLPTPIDLQRTAISKKVEKIFLIVIQDYRERANIKFPGAIPLDLLDHLVCLKGNEMLHAKEIVWLLSELILANTDNVATSLEWIIAHLMANSHLQRKIHQEIDHVCGQRPHLSMCDIEKMTYLTACIKESIRISCPIMFTVPHSTTKEVNIGGYRLPINTQIIIHLGALGKDCEIYKKPCIFDPVRFINENLNNNSQLKRHRNIVHSIAKKLCPSRGLDFLHIHIILINILQLFELSPLYGDVKSFQIADAMEWGVIHLLKKPLVACLKPHL